MESSFEGGVRGSSAVVERSVHSSLPFRKKWNEGRRCTESACEILLPFEDSPPGGLIRTDYFCTVIVEMKVVGRLMDAKGGGSVDGGRERRRG